MMVRVIRTLGRHWALSFVIATIGLTAVLGWYAVTTIGMNADTAGMLSRKLPFRKLWEDYKAAFPYDDDTLVIVLDGPNPDKVADSASRLVTNLRERPNLFQNVFYPQGNDYFRRNGLLYLSQAKLAELGDQLAEAQPMLATLARDPSLRGLFEILGLAAENSDGDGGSSGRTASAFDRISAVIEGRGGGKPTTLAWSNLMRGHDATPTERRRIIVVKPRLDYATIPPGRAPMLAVRAMARELGIGPGANGVRLRLTGSVALETEELANVEAGAGRASMLSLVLVSLLLFVGLRSWQLVVAVLATLITGLVWTAAFAAAVVSKLNLISVAFFVLFVGLAVDFGIHFALRFREDIDRGVQAPEALRATFQEVGGSLALTAVAAAVAFLSFVVTDYRGIAELGIISAGGMVIALILNLTLLPAFLQLLPFKPAPRPTARREMVRPGFIRRWARLICMTAAILGIAALPLMWQVQFESNPFNLKDLGTESVRTMLELVHDPDAAPYTASVVAPNLAAADRLAKRLKSLPLVDKVVTVRSLVPSEQRAKLAMIDTMGLLLGPVADGSDVKPAPTAAERRRSFDTFLNTLKAMRASGDAGPLAPSIHRLAAALAAFKSRRGLSDASLLALKHALIGTIGTTLADLHLALSARPVTLADVPKALRERYMTANGRARVEIIPKQDITDMRRLRAFVEQIRTVAPNVTHDPVNILEGGKVVIRAFQLATGLALIAVICLIALSCRRLRDAVLVLVPVVLAGLWTVAIATLAGIDFNLANIIVLPLLLGLCVANGIHLVRRAQIEPEGELLHTSTPRAVLFSALTTVSSFGSLAISGHRGTASMGQLLTIAIAVSLLVALVVLPATMELWRK